VSRRIEICPGDRFHRWTVVREVASRRHPAGSAHRFFLCRCDCGTEKEVNIHSLRYDHSKSCGCYKREVLGAIRREKHSCWRGGRYRVKGGYIMLNVDVAEIDERYHPMLTVQSHNRHSVFEHRLVLAQSLGRSLERYETVHHIDGDRANNSLENLQLRSSQHGPGQALQCNACGSHDITKVDLK
jgi:hypothetical protein